MNCYGEIQSDSLIRIYPLNRFSFSTNVSMFSILKYRLPNYLNLNPKPTTTCSKCEPYEKLKPYSVVAFDFQSISAGYRINDFFRLNLGVAHIHENFGFDDVNEEEIQPGIIKYTRIGTIHNRYYNLSPSISATLKSDYFGQIYTNLSAGVNFDFVYHERRKYGHEIIYSVTTSPSSPPTTTYYSNKDLTNDPRTDKMNFNRICPFVNLSLEWKNPSKTFSFSLGSTYTFESVYQLKNTDEFYKCIRVSPLILGWTYYFKLEDGFRPPPQP